MYHWGTKLQAFSYIGLSFQLHSSGKDNLNHAVFQSAYLMIPALSWILQQVRDVKQLLDCILN